MTVWVTPAEVAVVAAAAHDVTLAPQAMDALVAAGAGHAAVEAPHELIGTSVVAGDAQFAPYAVVVAAVPDAGMQGHGAGEPTGGGMAFARPAAMPRRITRNMEETCSLVKKEKRKERRNRPQRCGE